MMTVVMEITATCELCGKGLAEAERTWIGTAVDGTRIYVCAERCCRAVRRPRRYDPWLRRGRRVRLVCAALARETGRLVVAQFGYYAVLLGVMLAIAALVIGSDYLSGW